MSDVLERDMQNYHVVGGPLSVKRLWQNTARPSAQNVFTTTGRQVRRSARDYLPRTEAATFLFSSLNGVTTDHAPTLYRLFRKFYGRTGRVAGENFLLRADRLSRLEHFDAALDIVYEQIEQLVRSKSWQELDSLLRDAEPEALSTDIVVALLTATLPARRLLSERTSFFNRASDALKGRREWTEDLLTGLEA